MDSQLTPLVLDFEEKTNSCKGLVYKASINRYISPKTGVISADFKLSPRKKLSCPGCPMCDWIKEDLPEIFCNRNTQNSIHNMENMEDGKYYTIVSVVDSTDWETGYVDDYHFELREFDNNADR